MRIAVKMSVYDGDYQIARSMLHTLRRSLGNTRLSLYLVDDASNEHVGEKLRDEFNDHLEAVHLHRMDHPTQYRGMIQRNYHAFSMIHDDPEGFDLIARLDSDLLVAREGLDRFLADTTHNHKPAAWGIPSTLRKRDLILFLADLLPIGLRRQQQPQGVISRKWELKRTRPVWWSTQGWKCLLRAKLPTPFLGGSAIFLNHKAFQLIYNDAWQHYDPRRRGLINSEDDTLITTILHANNADMINLNQTGPSAFADLAWSTGRPTDDLYIVHPLKNQDAHRSIRHHILTRMGLEDYNHPRFGALV